MAESLCQFVLRSAAPFLCLFFVQADAMEPFSPGNLKQEWLDIQVNVSRPKRAEWGRNLTYEQLLEYEGADAELDIVDHRNWTALHSAARYNDDPRLVLLLLEAGLAVNAKDRSGDTPLHWTAAATFNVEVVNALLAAGANVNERDR